MPKKKQLIIPLFIPFAGCPNQCVYCDQTGITGSNGEPSLEDVRSTIESHLSTWKGAPQPDAGAGYIEAAFYGGTFTALPPDKQIRFLECAFPYVKDGRVWGLRVSTRPDAVSKEAVQLLLRYGVKTVELGAQSMSDEVLRLSGRGHASADTVRATRLLKELGVKTGLQFMPGLPGDVFKSVIHTAKEIIKLSPDFVRVYPAVVLKGTPLEKMYLGGRYAPWTLQDMVSVCSAISRLFKEAGIPIARMGLQNTEGLEKSIVAGHYHPSFRQLVEKAEQRDKAGAQIKACNYGI